MVEVLGVFDEADSADVGDVFALDHLVHHERSEVVGSVVLFEVEEGPFVHFGVDPDVERVVLVHFVHVLVDHVVLAQLGIIKQHLLVA